MKEIKGFRGEYSFLSNMYPCTVVIGELTYKCSESIYMAAKSGKRSDYERFQSYDGYTAKREGRKLTLRVDWNEKKLGIMKMILLCKFKQNPDIREKLLATGDAYIEETNYWKDTFWGVCNGVGQNHLGKLLMEVREELK